MYKDIIGQEAALRVLQRAVYSGRVPHAYLFAGPPNVGKTTVAMWLAKVLNCERNQGLTTADEVDCCDECETCRRFEQGNHPDLLVVRPKTGLKQLERQEDDEEGEDLGPTEIEGSLIKTEVIEHVVSHASLKVSAGRRKIYLIVSAELMNKEAENRLLKTLEEPPGDTTLILTSSNLSGLLPTTISRCQLLNFQPVSAGEAERRLRERFPALPSDQIHSLVALSSGRIGWAINMLQHPQVLTIRADLLDTCLRLPQTQMVECLRLGETLLEAAERWWLATADPAVAEKALKSSRDRVLRTRMTEILDVLLTWFRDLILIGAAPQAAQVINQDRLADLQQAAADYTPDACQKVCRYLEDMKGQLKQNANLRLAGEMIALRLISATRG